MPTFYNELLYKGAGTFLWVAFLQEFQGKEKEKRKKKKEMRVVFLPSLEHGLLLASLGVNFLTQQLLCVIS